MTRLTAHPEDIRSRAPLRQAALQMQPGWEAERGPWLASAYHADIPLPVRPVLFGEPDLTGLRVDRLTVIGPVDEAAKHGVRWLVRCICGYYETRRAQSLKGRMRADRAACQRCDYVEHLRRRQHFDRTGRWPADEPRHLTPPAPLTCGDHKPGDKGHAGKGDRKVQRARARARKRQKAARP